MTLMAIIFLCVGIFIFGMSTWLSPFIAFLISIVRKKSSNVNSQVSNSVLDRKLTLDILIPAHNEAESLPASLKSLRQLESGEIFTQPRLIVGLSHWQGPAADKASREADAVISISEAGKWKALVALIESSKADWVALVDSGTVWPKDMLIQLTKYFRQSDVMAINPRYSEEKSGLVQKLVWGLESQLKSIENLSGGPISLHGSTIFYRRNELQSAIQVLKSDEWWNDDVVVPLMLRKLYDRKKIIYATEVKVVDLFPASNINELKRRKRVLFGNLQWVKKLMPEVLNSQYLLGIIAFRRIARMLWAWAITFVCLGLLLMQTKLAFVYLTGAVILALMPKGRRLFDAFWVSLMMPVYLIFYNSDKVTWK
jgi:cellulose synthase/poly-beta-1,6-N-acetylglucosamine synthase-like glycosyltransferase